MSNNQDSNHPNEEVQFTTDELDAIGEVMNISMGSAATSLSSMLDRQVVITTPKMNVKPIHDEDYADLEPAMVVRIKFVEGVFGTNIMVFRRRDMQIILNLLMGNDEVPDENADFEFDELSMSAACEVSNQMMGAAATALSEVFNRSVNISTPDAFVSEAGQSINEVVFGSDTVEDTVGISFNLTINGVMNSSFMSVLPSSFAKEIIDILMAPSKEEPKEEPAPIEAEPKAAPQPAAPQPAAPQPAAPQPAAPQPAAPQPAAPQSPMMQPPAPQPAAPQPPMMQPTAPQPAAPQSPMMQPPAPQPAAPQSPMMQPPAQQQMPMMPQQMQQPMMPQQMGMPMMPQQGYYYPQQPMMMPQQNPAFAGPAGGAVQNPSVNVKKAKFPDFSQQENNVTSLNSVNMGMLMNVPLEVSVEIGKTRRPIKEIADFGQGTVIELEKQAGAPVDIIVNGQLLAHGDVVVIGDNFGVRITEIVGTKDLMDSLSNL
ncbi:MULTISPECIES: flagellar motor switch protein FliN [Caproicibacterium]|uniref:Flagellar motor switch protein FliN n=1 Tax=Caproicibacterium argilliputei TaxID=3030016 RepID=A0AA97H1F7_9FIRM|nr:flagellar motor switch protein FliN [Caproicibacterium argilliputei]WOC31262.1 flagellar motor switch protein FliN [Caproicibacterium argilliputei]